MKFLKDHKIIILLDQAIFSGTSFLTTILIARIISLEEFGLFAGYVLGMHLVVSCLSAFIIQPFQVFFTTVSNQKAYFSFIFWLQILTTIFLIGLTAIFAFIFKIHIALFFLPYAAGFIFQDFGRKFLLAINKPLINLMFDFVASLGLILSIFYFTFENQTDIFSLLKIMSLAYVLPFLLFLIVVKPFVFEKEVSIKSLNFHFKEGKWLFFTSITQWWSGNLFVVASGIYLGSAALGALRLAQSLMGILNVMLQTFENYILPQTSQRINICMQSSIDYVVDVTKKTGILFLIILFSTFIFSEQIFLLVGGIAYLPYAFILQGMTFLYVLIFVSQPLRLIIRALLLNQEFFYGYLFSLLFSLIFSKFLLENYGLKGVIIGLAASQIILIIYWTIILQKKNIQLWKSFM